MPSHTFSLTDPDELIGIIPRISGTPDNGPALPTAYGHGGPATLDLVLLKALGKIKGGIILLVCDIGFGKSWTIKHLLLYMLMLARANGQPFRIAADDLKEYNNAEADGDIASTADEGENVVAGGEYGPLATFTGNYVIDLPNAQMNILDPALNMGIEDVLRMERMIVMMLRGNDKELPRYWDSAIEGSLGALRKLPEKMQTFKMQLLLLNHNPEVPLSEADDDLAEILSEVPESKLKKITLWPTIEGIPQRIYPHEAYLEATSELLDTLKRLQGGAYGKMLNGNRSIAKLMRQQVVVSDYSKLDDTAIAMMQLIVQHIRAAAINRGDLTLMPHITVFDESHRFWGIPSFAKSTAHFFKTIRGRGAFVLQATQREEDIHATGSSLAINSLEDVSMIIVGHLSRTEAERLKERYKLSDNTTEAIQELERGQFIVLMHNQPPMFIEIPSTDLTRQLAETDQASMANLPALARGGLS